MIVQEVLQEPLDELNCWLYAQPTPEELRLSGGLLVPDWPHARHVSRLAVELFHATYALHHLDRQALRMLERAAFLHSTGQMVARRRHHKHTFYQIQETHLPDFSDEERYEIACVARYHRRALPSEEHEEFAALDPLARERVSLLAALLRIADALDCNHDGRVRRLSVDFARCTDTVWTLRLWVRPLADLDEELVQAYDKADLFEQVFTRQLHMAVSHE